MYSLQASDGSTVVLEESNCERDLGVMVDSELKFGQQVDAVVLKVNRQLGLIKRSFIYLDEETGHVVYNTSLVRPLLEYANIMWPMSFKKDIDKLEHVHRRATCLSPKIRQLHYPDRLKLLNLPSLVGAIISAGHTDENSIISARRSDTNSIASAPALIKILTLTKTLTLTS